MLSTTGAPRLPGEGVSRTDFALLRTDPGLFACLAPCRARWARLLASKRRLPLFDESLHAFSAIGRRVHFTGAIHLEGQPLLEPQLLRGQNRGLGFGDRDRRPRGNALCQLTRGVHKLRRGHDTID
jgi:hypothetical protein